MSKRLILFCLTIGMLSNGFYSSVLATDAHTPKLYSNERVLTKEGACNLISNNSGHEELSIPIGYTSIDDFAFATCKTFESVIIPDSVTEIGNGAFAECTGLTSITIPDSVTEIGNGAFMGCVNLTSIKVNSERVKQLILDSNYYIDHKVINVSTLENSRDNTENATNDPVQGKSMLTKEDAHKLIEMMIYTGQSNLIIPKEYTSICGSAFAGCAELESIIIPNSITEIGDNAFSFCKGLTSIFIPNSVTSIGKNAFFGCKGLKHIRIPNSVKTIGVNAFKGCTSLESILIYDSGRSGGALGDGVYNGEVKELIINSNSGINPDVITVRVPKKSTEEFSDLGETDIFSNKLTKLEAGNLISNNSSSTDLIIPEGYTSISDSAFAGCKELTSITIPSSVTKIGDGAFYGCNGLKHIMIPNSVKTIGVNAFKNCISLNDVTVIYDNRMVPEREKERIHALLIQGGVNDKVNIKFITPDGVEAVVRNTLTSIKALNLLEEHRNKGEGYFETYEQYTTIGQKAFAEKDNIVKVMLGKCIAEIEEEAFARCSNLTSVVLPSTIEFIDKSAFEGCTNLTSVCVKRADGQITDQEKGRIRALMSEAIHCEIEFIDNTGNII